MAEPFATVGATGRHRATLITEFESMATPRAKDPEARPVPSPTSRDAELADG